MQKTSVASNVEAMIRSYIAENILFSKNGYPYPDDTSFLEGGIVDSTNVLELVMFAEKSFNIKVDDQDIVPDNFDSVAKLAAYVRRKVPSAN
jgi:acyl carrier protein